MRKFAGSAPPVYYPRRNSRHRHVTHVKPLKVAVSTKDNARSDAPCLYVPLRSAAHFGAVCRTLSHVKGSRNRVRERMMIVDPPCPVPRLCGDRVSCLRQRRCFRSSRHVDSASVVYSFQRMPHLVLTTCGTSLELLYSPPFFLTSTNKLIYLTFENSGLM